MLPIQHFVSLLLVCSISPVLLVDGQKKLIAPRWIPKSRPFKGENNVAQLTGSDINLTCPASGNPTPKTTWYKNGDWFNASQRLNTETRRFSLLLNDTQTSDTGEYSCVVHNSEGSLNFTYTVNIIRRPWPLEVEEPQNVTVMEGERVVFRCRVLNDPDATTQWIKRDTEVGDTGGYNKDI
ncbi:fibroblast growth factor receptor-like 1 [Saccostrea echinata]|uniref:fibroblast growth factor receptor-like 1 n=1 Tax=Saccostrea echinata TaxID=191078 RepID=UPI002A7F1F2F|nr:fibroblast growth factor receptor-like 1 [Saccostrea echinata]